VKVAVTDKIVAYKNRELTAAVKSFIILALDDIEIEQTNKQPSTSNNCSGLVL
jgi:hypothetical protein